MEAARTVKQCRHILKWTYVYGYYFDGTDGAKELFEMQQVSRCPDVFSPMFSWIQSAMGQTSHTVSLPPRSSSFALAERSRGDHGAADRLHRGGGRVGD